MPQFSLKGPFPARKTLGDKGCGISPLFPNLVASAVGRLGTELDLPSRVSGIWSPDGILGLEVLYVENHPPLLAD